MSDSPQKKGGSSLCLVLVSLLVIALGIALAPILTAKSVFKDKLIFSDCNVWKRDPVTGLNALTNETIEVHQVDYGVKFVQAETMEGSVFGLGFIHGKDRLWQLQFWRHLAQGRLSELFGPDTVPMDRVFRLFELNRACDEHLRNIPQEDLDLLENYSAGVNKAVEEMQVWPPEFYMLWNSFEPWTPKDSLSMQILLIYGISSDWFGELLRERLLEIYDKEFVDKLMPYRMENFQEFQHELITTISEKELERIGMLKEKSNANELYDIDENLLYKKPKKDRLETISRSSLTDDRSYRPSTGGSNCYAVHGNHTESGKALLACDPHLVKSISSVWYLTRLSWSETDQKSGEKYGTYMLGGSIVGMPFFTYARSPFGAIGATALNPDITDMFVEDVRTVDGREQYFDALEQTYKDFEESEEVIKVRFGSDVVLKLQHTPNGVIIPHDLLYEKGEESIVYVPREVLPTKDQQEEGKAYSIGFVMSPTTQKRHNNGVFKLPSHVRNTWNLLTVKNANLSDGNLMAKAIRDNLQFPLNLVFTLEEPGDIGFISAGIFPKRKHNVAQGVYTKIGSKIENRWLGVIASTDLPYVVNPDKGYIVNCNNFLSTDRMEHGLSHAFTFNHRKVRISEMIEEVINSPRKVNADDMKRIQRDDLDIQMRQSIPDMVTTVNKGLATGKLKETLRTKAQLGLKILKDWDFRMDKDKAGGSIAEAWEFALATYMHETKIDDVRIRRGLLNIPTSEEFVYGEISRWAKEEATNEVYCLVYELNADNTCQEFLAFTLAKAVMDVEERLGPYSEDNWRLGNLVSVRFEHLPFSETPLRGLFEEWRDHSGNRRTPTMQMHFYQTTKKRYMVQAGAVFKMIIDMNDPASAEFTTDTEVDMAGLKGAPKLDRFSELWQNDEHFRVPTRDLAGSAPFNLNETSAKIILNPSFKLN